MHRHLKVPPLIHKARHPKTEKDTKLLDDKPAYFSSLSGCFLSVCSNFLSPSSYFASLWGCLCLFVAFSGHFGDV